MTGVQTCALPICFPVTINYGYRAAVIAKEDSDNESYELAAPTIVIQEKTLRKEKVGSTKLWEAMGISRATYYRRKKKGLIK